MITVLLVVAVYVALYWILTLAAFVVPVFASSYGSTTAEVLTDARDRMARVGRFSNRRDGRLYWLAYDASYWGRVAIHLRLAAKLWHRGAHAAAMLGALDGLRAAVCGPFERVLCLWTLWPITTLATAFGAHVERRYIIGRTLRQDLLLTWWTFGEWRSLRSRHRASRPTWQEARTAMLEGLTPEEAADEPIGQPVKPSETASLTAPARFHAPPSQWPC